MDNHAGKLTQIVWLAGITDGDGCIGLHKQKYGKNTNYIPSYSLSTTCQKTYQYIENLLSELQIGHHWVFREVQKPNWRNRWVVEIRGMKRLKKILNIIAPYLITKRDEAVLVLQFVNIRKGINKNIPYGHEELSIVKRLHDIKISRNGTV